MTNLERFQMWYMSQCDEDWEHTYGVRISTIDNPGWSVDIALDETSLEGREFKELRIERSKNDWLFAWSTSNKFNIACGPNNLEEGLGIFCDWAEV